MLAGDPLRFAALVFHIFSPVVSPDNPAVPVNFRQVRIVLIGRCMISSAQCPEQITAADHLVRHALEIFVETDNAPVHVDQYGPFFLAGKQCVAALALFRNILCRPGRINRWSSHNQNPPAGIIAGKEKPGGQAARLSCTVYGLILIFFSASCRLMNLVNST